MKSGSKEREDLGSSLVCGVRGLEPACILLRVDEEGMVISRPVMERSGLLLRRLSVRDRENAAGVDRPDRERLPMLVRRDCEIASTSYFWPSETKLVELSRFTSQLWPFSSRADEASAIPARSIHSGSRASAVWWRTAVGRLVFLLPLLLEW
jgi:hypothetical protein